MTLFLGVGLALPGGSASQSWITHILHPGSVTDAMLLFVYVNAPRNLLSHLVGCPVHSPQTIAPAKMRGLGVATALCGFRRGWYQGFSTSVSTVDVGTLLYYLAVF